MGGIAIYKILIADDSMFARNRLKDTVLAMNHDVIGEAVNGIDAVQQFKTLNPDITFLDITMPDMDGISALREIRKHNPAAVVIMISAIRQDTVVAEAISLGARGFLAKPADIDILNKIFSSI